MIIIFVVNIILHKKCPRYHKSGKKHFENKCYKDINRSQSRDKSQQCKSYKKDHEFHEMENSEDFGSWSQQNTHE